MIVLYTIPAPYAKGTKFIRVQGSPEEGWRWHLIEIGPGHVQKEVFDENQPVYDSGEIALRDALIATSPLPR